MRPSLYAGMLIGIVGCVSRTRPVTPREVTLTEGVSAGTDAVQSVVRLAIALDAAGDRHADTLYAADALVIANARIRLSAPRFAGIATGGQVVVTAANATVGGQVAWVLLDYRWVNPAERRTEIGRATVICEHRASGWKIVHVHSSQPLPWE